MHDAQEILNIHYLLYSMNNITEKVWHGLLENYRNFAELEYHPHFQCDVVAADDEIVILSVKP